MGVTIFIYCSWISSRKDPLSDSSFVTVFFRSIQIDQEVLFKEATDVAKAFDIFSIYRLSSAAAFTPSTGTNC